MANPSFEYLPPEPEDMIVHEVIAEADSDEPGIIATDIIAEERIQHEGQQIVQEVADTISQRTTRQVVDESDLRALQRGDSYELDLEFDCTEYDHFMRFPSPDHELGFILTAVLTGFQNALVEQNVVPGHEVDRVAPIMGAGYDAENDRLAKISIFFPAITV